MSSYRCSVHQIGEPDAALYYTCDDCMAPPDDLADDTSIAVHGHFPGDGGEIDCHLCNPELHKPEFGTSESLYKRQLELDKLSSKELS